MEQVEGGMGLSEESLSRMMEERSIEQARRSEARIARRQLRALVGGGGGSCGGGSSSSGQSGGVGMLGRSSAFANDATMPTPMARQ